MPGILPAPVNGAPAVATRGDVLTVSGPGWTYRFDDGDLASMKAHGRELLAGGPRLDAYRPPTSNETYDWGTDDRRIWHDIGLDRLQTTITDVRSSTESDAVVVEVRSTVAGGRHRRPALVRSVDAVPHRPAGHRHAEAGRGPEG
nr:hypothetical protein GCM10020092_079740 [Actinoplanes digitatis]